MLFTLTFLLLVKATFAQPPPQDPQIGGAVPNQGANGQGANGQGANGQGGQNPLPDFVSNFLRGLNPGQTSGPRQSFVPANVPPPPQSAPAVNIPLSTSALPNVYGPLAANWSACPAGFDCCGAAVYADPYSNYECCGEDSFDRRYQKCDPDRGIVPLTPNGPKESATTRLGRLNCGGYLYVADEAYLCCNFDVFDPSTHECKDGEIKPLPPLTQPSLPYGSVFAVCGNYRYVLASGATLTWGCCGQDLYNYNTENCTTQGIIPPRTHEIQSQVPAAQGLLVFCAGFRYWVNPNALSTIRCCGFRLCSAMYQPAMLPQSSPVIGGIGSFTRQ